MAQYPPLSLVGPGTDVIVEYMPNHFRPGKIKLNWWDKSLEYEFTNYKGESERQQLGRLRFTVDKIGK